MQIFIRTVLGKTITVDYKDGQLLKIYQIMEKIEDKTGIPVYCQRLQYRCKHLEKHKTMEYYDIFDGSTIHQLSKIAPSQCNVCSNGCRH